MAVQLQFDTEPVPPLCADTVQYLLSWQSSVEDQGLPASQSGMSSLGEAMRNLLLHVEFEPQAPQAMKRSLRPGRWL
jgi:hypothetical protein